jgi:RimJ/RimL family protein N-acetyltransferase
VPHSIAKVAKRIDMPDTQMNLESPRVCLRELKLTDLVDVYVNIRHKGVGRWSQPPPFRCAENALGRFAWRLGGHLSKVMRVVRQMIFPPRVRTEVRFAIVIKETDKVIGVVTLSQISQPHRSAQVGFWIGRRYWGRGLTTEALKLVLEFSFTELKLDRVDAWTFEKNMASIRVMEKCGFKLGNAVRRAYFKFNQYHDQLNYRILKSEWSA